MNIDDMRYALKRGIFCGVILYEGPSAFDGAPIVIIANRIETASSNDKTGAMVQSFILHQDIAPNEALKTGDDGAVCGTCPLRPIAGGNTRCYVRVYQAPLSTWKAYKRGRYARPGVDFPADLLPEIFRGKSVRLGTYGDPAAAPIDTWIPYVKYARKRTGYTHAWRLFPEFTALCMASVDDVRDMPADGARYFRVRKKHEKLLPGEIVCPASAEGGKRVSCADCGLCAGSQMKGKSIVIMDHGPLRNRA